jgi:hypothetical protein
MRKLNISLLFLIIYSTSASQSESKIDWKSDLEYLKKELPEKHINLFFSVSENDFNLGIDKLIQDLPHLNDYQVADRLLQHLAKIGDTHIFVDFGKLNDPNQILPFSLSWFSDGLYILYAKEGYENLLGKKIIALNDYKIEQIIDSLSTLIPFDNKSNIRNRVPQMLSFLPHLKYFGFIKGKTIQLKIQSSNDSSSVMILSDTALANKKWTSYHSDSLAFCWNHKYEYFVEKYFDSDSIYYLQYNKCDSRELKQKFGNSKESKKLPSFSEFEKNVFGTIKNKPVKKLIVDMRFNGGGTSDQGTEFINKLKNIKLINQKGKLFVITGYQTFSSGLVNVMDFKNLTNAIFIGEETSGKPNHYGDIRSIILPSSKLRIDYSTKYFKYSNEDLKCFKPDIIIETSFSDYKSGIDPVYEYIKGM